VADDGAVHTRVVTIVNTKGLHARASAKFVQTANKFEARITVKKDGGAVSGSSIMGLMMLGAGIGSELAMEASGRQAQAALDALAELVANRFGEDS